MWIRWQQHDNNGSEGWAKTDVHAGTQGKLLKDGSALGRAVPWQRRYTKQRRRRETLIFKHIECHQANLQAICLLPMMPLAYAGAWLRRCEEIHILRSCWKLIIIRLCAVTGMFLARAKKEVKRTKHSIGHKENTRKSLQDDGKDKIQI